MRGEKEKRVRKREGGKKKEERKNNGKDRDRGNVREKDM